MTTHRIRTVAFFKPIVHGKWKFHCSVSNATNVMIMRYHDDDPDTFEVRFFDDQEKAHEYVKGCLS